MSESYINSPHGGPDEFWARPGQSLGSHLDNVARLACEFARDIGLPNAGFLLGRLHDEAKASQAFQNYIRSGTGFLDQEDERYVDAAGKRRKIDHSTAGAQKIWACIKGIPLNKPSPLFTQMLALCLCSHHSGLIDCLGLGGEDAYKRRIGKDTDKMQQGSRTSRRKNDTHHQHQAALRGGFFSNLALNLP